ncbi:hypothetical protein B0H15DRAFT_957044 [Mycena belliarum]|uniref:Uncharacterized protein n=1 Tax=Mycena belliarum TaxID=1033014 RepID=A0AAD6TT34_9AGAR|nr:hypothetical protein B0H15DRAFT_957044 [Mycena belliae]
MTPRLDIRFLPQLCPNFVPQLSAPTPDVASVPPAPPSRWPKKTATGSPAKRKSRAKKPKPADKASSDVEIIEGKREQVNWAKNSQWTDLLVSYLTENPTFRIKLFSDSTADAKKEKRAKQVAKDGKTVQYGVLAKHIFADDNNEAPRYANDPVKYATSVETRLRRLKKEYIKILTRIGATGAGIDPELIRAGSQLDSLIGEVRDSWPWWDDLHAFWRELPNYNPIGVQSSEPGTDHASAAADIFAQTGGEENDGDGEDDEEDGLSDASKERRRQDVTDSRSDSGGDEHSRHSSPDLDDDDLYRELSKSPTPPPALPVKKPTKKGPQKKTKATPAPSGRDLGLAKANAAPTTAAAKKRPQTALDRMNDIREGESARLGEKRKLQHEEEMERIKIKRLKYELKLLQAENERTRLNRHATSESPRRRTRVLNLSPSSPSRSRASRYSPRHVEFHAAPSFSSPAVAPLNYALPAHSRGFDFTEMNLDLMPSTPSSSSMPTPAEWDPSLSLPHWDAPGPSGGQSSSAGSSSGW